MESKVPHPHQISRPLKRKSQTQTKGSDLAAFGETNYALLKQLLSEDDFAYVTGHPEFRMRNVWDIIVFAWLTPDDSEEKTAGFVSEDEVRVKKSRRASKKEPSAR